MQRYEQFRPETKKICEQVKILSEIMTKTLFKRLLNDKLLILTKKKS